MCSPPCNLHVEVWTYNVIIFKVRKQLKSTEAKRVGPWSDGISFLVRSDISSEASPTFCFSPPSEVKAKKGGCLPARKRAIIRILSDPWLFTGMVLFSLQLVPFWNWTVPTRIALLSFQSDFLKLNNSSWNYAGNLSWGMFKLLLQRKKPLKKWYLSYLNTLSLTSLPFRGLWLYSLKRELN